MTMIIWAACDGFAVMMADRRVLRSRVVANAERSEATFGDLARGEDTEKAFLSADRRDIFAIAGTTSQPYAKGATRLHGVQADEAILNSVRPNDPLACALDAELLPHPNTILHSYAHAGRIMCCRHEWSPTSQSRLFIVAPANQLAVNTAGVGSLYIQGFVNAEPTEWNDIVKRVDDPAPVRAYLGRFFKAVSCLHVGVSAETDTWVLAKVEGVWTKVA